MIINEISRGITHIEDLPINEFIQVIQRLHEYNITEKVDGAQILFGIDDIGFYTSRESKGGIRIYNEADYDIEFRTTYMRSAHKLLEKVLPQLKEAGLIKGSQIEAEVLYGALPNVVPYSESVNYLIFLRTTEGTVNINSIKSRLNDKSHSISLLSPFTTDGKSIQLKEETNNWQFAAVPKIRVNISGVQDMLKENVESMTRYLNKSSGISTLSNMMVEGLPLNKRPDWCEPQNWKFVKTQIKEQRSEITKTVNEQYISIIKEKLLDNLVHSQYSKFGPSLEEGGWIEGVVLRHPHSGKMVKIVDKNKFGIIRESAWKIRNSLTDHAKCVEGDHSFLGNMFLMMATSIGHPDLGTMQAKNYLRKVGTINEERLNNLSEGIDVESIKEYWLSLLEQKKIQLEDILDNYEKEKIKPENKSNMAIFEKTAKGYNYGIDKRTKEVFATLFEQMASTSKKIVRVRVAEELLEILIGKQLKEIE